MKLILVLSIFFLSACEQKKTTEATEVPPSYPDKHSGIWIAPAATPKPTETSARPVSNPAPDPHFKDIELRPEWTNRLDRVVAGMVRDKDKYEAIQKMRNGGMPWFIVAGIHERESGRNFTRHLHEGSPLIHRTRDVPKNRLPPPKEPPYTWPESAEDALYVLKREQDVNWLDYDNALDAIEKYNGLGYRKYHPEVKTPYLWSGTTCYERGKYVSDGRFSATAIDAQAGVAALWKRMIERGLL